jgi:4-alpha-glucanotransferase
MVSKKTHNESSHRLLARLAELYGVQTRYRDALGRGREPSQESLLKTLLALGAEVNGLSGLVSAVRVREAEVWGTMIEPVIVAWEGVLPGLVLRLPASTARSAAASARLALTLEDGSVAEGEVPLGRFKSVGGARVGGRSFVALWLPGGQLKRAVAGGRYVPFGYHRLRVEVQGRGGEAMVIAAPRRCWELGSGGDGPVADGVGTGSEMATETVADPLRLLTGKRWGLFAPVYALRSRRNWGAGDLADLGALARWTGEQGGSLVATLPLLSASFGEASDPSPYRPLTRLFWNEFFLAPEGTEEWASCDLARARSSVAESVARQGTLRDADVVDYQAVMALKRPAMEQLARCFFEQMGEARHWDYEDYLRDNPFARDYAAFRAAEEDGGPIGAGGGAEAGRGAQPAEQYHLYCQWQMDRQLAALSGGGRPGLLFDLPLGVHPDGFDVARWPGLFASGVSTGAPPDAFFAGGQDWTTPPLHPQADRRDGYPYFGACLRNLMRHASVLRIDHMMSFHRLFWIPAGMEPNDGAYVTYPAEEMYAVLSRESHRCQTAVVGEDLGTVPGGVRASMARHAVARTWIFLGSLRPRAKIMAAEVPRGAVVTLETHDMVPLAGFLRGDDIATRAETGQLDSVGGRRECAARRRQVARLAGLFGASEDDAERAARTILAGCLAYMARSAAQMVLVNLEDLLLERRPQNVPGTQGERPNWRRKIAVPLEDLPRPDRVPPESSRP